MFYDFRVRARQKLDHLPNVGLPIDTKSTMLFMTLQSNDSHKVYTFFATNFEGSKTKNKIRGSVHLACTPAVGGGARLKHGIAIITLSIIRTLSVKLQVVHKTDIGNMMGKNL